MSVYYCNDASESDLPPLNKDTIASQPVVPIVAAVNVQNTVEHSWKTESPAITFWTTDLFPTPNILEMVSHPDNAWMNNISQQTSSQVNVSGSLCYTFGLPLCDQQIRSLQSFVAA